jgi:phosphoribosyl-ATP pyrophosphohydrolase
MGKSAKKTAAGKTEARPAQAGKGASIKAARKVARALHPELSKRLPKKLVKKVPAEHLAKLLPPLDSGADVLDRLWQVVMSRREADPTVSHSARLLSRGTAKVAQKFGEEAVECLIEAVGGDRTAMIAESADVLYHLIVLWVSIGVEPREVWQELQRREGVSGIAEKASRPKAVPRALGMTTSKIP